MALSEAMQVWNRACFDSSTAPRPGDVALTDLLRAHNMMMNGGVFHAVETLSESERAAATAGYRFFGFVDVVEFLERTFRIPESQWGKLERSTDIEYGRLIPTDGHLSAAFERHFNEHRELYAPVSDG